MSTLQFKASELASRLGAELLGPGDVALHRLDSLDQAGPGSLAFIRTHRFARRWPESKASAAIISRSISLSDLVPGFDPASPSSPRPLLIVPDADLAAIQAAELFAPRPEPHAPGVHPSAVIEAGATIAPSAWIGPHCVIMTGATVGERCALLARVTVSRDVRIGDHTVLHPGVTVLDRCVVGARCIFHAGVVIGADGFGYRPAPDGRGLVKIPHIGNVVIEDDVEIGANSCVDRAKFGTTLVGAGTKIDNLVQVGHNCRIGRGCCLCGHVGLAGSVILGDGVMVGGQAGVSDNVEIGAGAKISAGAGVTSDVPPGSVYMGIPAGPASEWRRVYAMLRRIGKRGQQVEH
ncbi:UDP-3-O-[3-hydroxymyristoyl] glucosamine N-acyltransferase [Phycisphaerales bacterium]|nr:UDP-3-O-[3-hydroxymyristoyl] glucosamine N-acyltransferase [Phycisphaerales bacterium]